MKRLLAIALGAVFFCGVSVPTTSAQLGEIGNALSKNKKQQTDPNDISNVDKDKIVRIEAMPEVADAIQQEWDQLRRNDMQLAYGINLTEHMGLSQDASAGDSFDRQRLYANPVVQSYVNHVGQMLVPKNSSNVYTFRVLYDPIPKALTLSTGTIYLSTGLISMLNSESELSYVLAHEIAHVELRQAYLRIRDKHIAEEIAKEKAEKEKMITDVGSLVMGAGLGGAMIPLRLGGLLGGSAGLATGMEVGHYFIHPQIEPVLWASKEEDDADDMAVNLMLQQGYDPREVARLFASLNQVVTADSRMGLGFMGSAPRIKERQAHLDTLLNGQLKAEIELRTKGKGFNPNSPDFGPTVSSVKRDNGILSMDYDLFAVAKRNLLGAVADRPDDPYANFYLAKLERLTARTPEERQDALNHLNTALRLDADRGAIPAAHLEFAVALMEAEDPSNHDQISSELKSYVVLSERDHGGLPADMPLIYDYLSGAGDSRWYLPPQWYDAQLTNNPGFTTTSPEAVIRKATMLEGPPPPQAPALADASAHPKTKPAASHATKKQ
ncbi:MAG TPA: M48 family metalloprotease [Terracidiphilus sp.]|nr:M48 family metalloprotease [Terracidiphilus sp.]